MGRCRSGQSRARCAGGAINTRSVPGFHLNRQDHAHRIVQAVGAANVKVQMDLFHCQIVEGDLSAKIAQYLPTGRVGHFQIAEVPHRHEPGTGEVNWTHIFQTIDKVSAECGWGRLDRLRVQPGRCVGGWYFTRPELGAALPLIVGWGAHRRIWDCARPTAQEWAPAKTETIAQPVGDGSWDDHTIGKGKARKRLPLSDAIALAMAGAKGGRPTSPMPPGWLSVGITFTITSGVSLARSTWYLFRLVC